MTVAEAVKGVRRLAVDTSAVIDFVERAPRSIVALQKIFALADTGELTLVGSSVLLTETLPVDGVPSAMPVAAYETALERIERSPVTEEIARRAAEIRSVYGLASLDALHLATAIELSCQAFLTCDGDFLRAQGIPISSGQTLRILKADRLT